MTDANDVPQWAYKAAQDVANYVNTDATPSADVIAVIIAGAHDATPPVNDLTCAARPEANRETVALGEELVKFASDEQTYDHYDEDYCIFCGCIVNGFHGRSTPHQQSCLHLRAKAIVAAEAKGKT